MKKFKGLCEGKWVFGNCIIQDMRSGMHLARKFAGTYVQKWVDVDCICESTGLIDMHRNEIYEGDLLQEQSTLKIYQVAWSEEHGAWVCIENKRSFKKMLFSLNKKCTVVGNINQKAK